MLPRIRKAAGLPPAVETKKAQFRALLRAYPIARDLTKRLVMPRRIHEKVREAWLTESRPERASFGRRVEGLACLDTWIHLSRHGDVTVFARLFLDRSMEVGIAVFDQNTDLDENGEGDCIEISVRSDEDSDPDEKTVKWLRECWKAVPTVQPALTLRAAPRQGPNDPCLCGSGRKFKRCCGCGR